LIFPHHENESPNPTHVLQARLAGYWLHTGMVKVEGKDVQISGHSSQFATYSIGPVDPMAVRVFVLMAQYRKPVEFTDDAIESATNGWNTLKDVHVWLSEVNNSVGVQMV
jgi:cysteinyl-tRNA synthetase